MLKPLTDIQKQALDTIVAKIPKVSGKERNLCFSVLEIEMGDYLMHGYDVTTYLSVYTAMTKVYGR